MLRHQLIFGCVVAGVAVVLFTDLAVAQTQTPFRQCVGRQIPLLDDLISSADVVAGGVVEKCREWADTSYRANEVLAALKLRIVPLVLEHRSALRQANQIWRDELVRTCGDSRTGHCAELSR